MEQLYAEKKQSDKASEPIKNGHLYEVNDLAVSFSNEEGTFTAVDGVSFHINKGEIISFVGESGSGKSVTQLAALQLLNMPPARIESGEVLLEKQDLLKYKQNSAQMQKIRGGSIGMIFQEPMTSLDPIKTIGYQLMEAILIHAKCGEKEARKRAITLLSDVGIPDPETRIDDYPHQFSGGMRQRIMIAIAISGNPKLIIADEPTTALDVTTQSQILELLNDITRKYNTALLFVTHNLGVVARYAQRIYVMYAGTVVESGLASDIFADPCHPYTRGLLKAVPRLDDDQDRALVPIEGTPLTPKTRPAGCLFGPRCKYRCDECPSDSKPLLKKVGDNDHYSVCVLTREQMDEFDQMEEIKTIDRNKEIGDTVLSVKNLNVTFDIRKGIFRRKVGSLSVLKDVSFEVHRGETLGLVGESGCGKTTAARSILQLLPGNAKGEILFKNKNLGSLTYSQMQSERRKIQMIFQDPFSSLNPRKNISFIVGEPLIIHKLVKTRSEYNRRVDEILSMVGIDPSLKGRVAHEFSGGQRQRVGIARALASNPDLIVCDEPISALDVSIQAQIINLLEDLQKEIGLTYVFIAHDLSVVKHISDTIAVMYLGRIVERASCTALYENPQHPYTNALLSAIPIPDPEIELTRERIVLKGEVPSIVRRPQGCPFCDRCAQVMDKCRVLMPEPVQTEPGHWTSCYLYSK